MFNIGDKVFYPMHGAGIIEDIEEREVMGQRHQYYCLRMPIGDMRLFIPMDNTGAFELRKIITYEEAKEILGSLSTLEIDMPDNWNKRYRNNLVQLKSGNLTEVAKVVKGLILRENERSLSTGERKMLLSAKNILISELVLATGLLKDEVECLIDKEIMA